MSGTTVAYIGAALAALNGAYMLGDGVHRLAKGSYFGPSLGPWASIVRGAAIDPLSPATAWAFIAFGAAWCAAAVAALRGRGRHGIIALAVLTLWYAPFGTAVALLEMGLALRMGARTPAR